MGEVFFLLTRPLMGDPIVLGKQNFRIERPVLAARYTRSVCKRIVMIFYFAYLNNKPYKADS